jgi:hypothetical protein
MTTEQYDECMKRLNAAGAGVPEIVETHNVVRG